MKRLHKRLDKLEDSDHGADSIPWFVETAAEADAIEERTGKRPLAWLPETPTGTPTAPPPTETD